MVRGYSKCKYHGDILDKFIYEEIENIPDAYKHWNITCPGGGRIEHKNT